jgi:Cft2 family RNA processing exonuclease
VSPFDLFYDRGGICLPRLKLWLDPAHAKAGDERVFVSHAHSDHIGRHREVILTEATRCLMRHRIGARRMEHALEFGRRVSFGGDWQITLLPAGHILGSAMAWIETGGQSLLYTGDFKLRPGAVAEVCEPRHADVLVMETTFGRPEYVFPKADEVMGAFVLLCMVMLYYV